MIIESLQKELDKEILTFEERKYIIDEMVKVSNMVNEKDTENKKFLFGLAMVAGTVITTAIGVVASTLGSSSKIEDSNNDIM